MPEISDTASTLHTAATVVLLRDSATSTDGATASNIEVLLLRRNSRLAFHGGSWVFPGGRVDAEDYPAAHPNDTGLAATHAAVREAFEEAAVVIELGDLVHFAHWTTPTGRPKRFATWFFAARARSGNVRVDGGEIHDYRWMRPNAALAAQKAGDIELPAPTYVSLLKLSNYASCEQALSELAAEPVEVFVPRYHQLDDGACSVYEQDAAYESGDLDASGARHRLWMAPGRWHYERDF